MLPEQLRFYFVLMSCFCFLNWAKLLHSWVTGRDPPGLGTLLQKEEPRPGAGGGGGEVGGGGGVRGESGRRQDLV